MSFDSSKDEPRWASEAQETWLTSQREDLAEHFGPDAVMSVMRMTALFAELLHMDRSNLDLIKAGVDRMAYLVNQMLPSLNGRQRKTRVYDYRDLDGALGDIPERYQEVFVECVGTVLLNSKGGPHETAVILNEKVVQLAELVKGGANE